jgi:hypothetical protein
MTYMADVDTTAQHVKVGDHIRVITGNRDYLVEVADVKIGTKWTAARDADGQLIWRKPNEDQVWAIREVKTEEELAAEKAELERKAAEFRLQQLENMHAKMHAGIALAQETLNANLAKGFHISPSDIEAVVTAHELKTIAINIDRTLEHNENMNILEAMEKEAEVVKNGLIDGFNEPTQSGGFTFENASRQTKIAARRSFLRGINWGMLY